MMTAATKTVKPYEVIRGVTGGPPLQRMAGDSLLEEVAFELKPERQEVLG